MQGKKEEYNTLTTLGFKRMRESTIVICTLVRDVADRMREIVIRSERMGKMFKDYRILVVENDSKDGTRRLLTQWRIRNPKVVILGCGVNSEEECKIKIAKKKTDGHKVDRGRIEKMVYLRNLYLSYICDNLQHFDYTMVWDLDIIGSVYLDGVANTMGWFARRPDANAICANGIYRIGVLAIYYDSYAHLDKGDTYHIKYKTWHDVKSRTNARYQRGDDLKEVISGFGGCTMYRTRKLCEAKYDMSPPGNIECEHVRLHKKMKGVYVNPSMIHYVLVND
jgi:hypothetical protein